MALIVADRVKETTTSIGLGPINLAGAVTNFRKFSTVCSIGDTCFYTIEDVANEAWEVGIGTYTALNTLDRTTVLASNNGGAKVLLGTGTKNVWIDAPASQYNSFVTREQADTLYVAQSSSSGSTGTTTDQSTYVAPFGRPAALYGAMTLKEEFVGSSLDRSLWSDLNTMFFAPTPNGKTNVAVSNGTLSMWPQGPWTNQGSGSTFTNYNATITTDGTFSQKYGYFEIMATLPVGVGPWPAFWLYNHDINAGGIDPATGQVTTVDLRPEIDIMEAYSGGGSASGWSTDAFQPNNYAGTCWPRKYTGTPIASRALASTIGAVRLDTFPNRYGVHWDATGVQFYFNGQPVGTKIDTSAEYVQHMYILLDLWMGSASGTPTSGLEQDQGNSFVVHYCYAWHLADGSSSVVTNLPAPNTGATNTGGTTATTIVDPASGSATPYGQTSSAWGSLIFSDEFNGTSLDSNYWIDLQPWDTQSVINYNVSGGCLNIFPQADANGVFYTREISTRGKFAAGYGYYEAEMELCHGQGTRCMFGLRAYDTATGTAHFLNIMTAYPSLAGWSNSSGGATRFDGGIYDVDTEYNEVDTSAVSFSVPDMSVATHKYGIKWEATGFQLYFDGSPVGAYQTTTQLNGRLLSPAFALEMGTGGAAVPSASDNTVTPQGANNSFKINYVRAWKPASSGTKPSVHFFGASLIYGQNGGSGPNPVTLNIPTIVAANTGMTTTLTANPGTSSTMFVNGSNGWLETVEAQFQNMTESVAVVNFVVNDWANDEATYKANLTRIVQAAATYSKRLVFMGSQTTYQTISGGTTESDVWVGTANQWMRDVATANNTPMIDVYAYVSAWEQTNSVTAAQFTPDGLHPVQTGYTLIGNYVAAQLQTILGL